MSKVEIVQLGAYPAWFESRLSATFVTHRYFEAGDKQAFLAERAGRVRGIAGRGDMAVDRGLIEALPKLEIIAVFGVGFDGVDLDAARDHGVRVTNTPDVLTNDVADLAIAMMLAHTRRIISASEWIRSGQWAAQGDFALTGRGHGKRAGVLGLGRIGYAVAKRLAAFDMDIGYHDVKPRDDAPGWRFYDDAVALADGSDILFVTVAANAATRGIVSRRVIEALGPGGMLVNISRASNVDEEALLNALEKKTLGSAALDVFEREPNLNPRFLALDNVLLQPHHASGTLETRKAMADLVFENLVAQFEGRDLATPVL